VTKAVPTRYDLLQPGTRKQKSVPATPEEKVRKLLIYISLDIPGHRR
jgi:hypothetical protein